MGWRGLTNFVTAVSPGEMFTLFMNATGIGLWQVICHVSDHQAMGMVGDYWVHDEPCPLLPLSGS
jgi:hypothetical protein